MPEIAGDDIGYRISVDGLSQLDGLRNVIKDIKKRMPEMSKSIKAAQASVKGLNSEIARGSGNRLAQEQHGFDGVTSSVKDTESAVKRATRQTDGLKQSMTRAIHSGNFNSQISSMQRVTQSAKKASDQYKKFSSVGDRFTNVGHKMALTSFALGAAFVKSADDAVKLQHSFRETTNLLTYGGEKASEATRNVGKMQDDASKYSVRYGVSQRKIADGYQELVKRGYDSNQALGAQKSLLQASIASGDDYSDVVHNATTTLESFGMRAKTTSGMIKNTKTVVNQMAYASDLTATDFQSMGKAMEYVGATAHLSGITLHETASSIGILSNNGLEADKAGTGLRKALVSLQSPGKAAIQAMKDIGVSTKDFVKSNGDMKSMTDIFGILNQHTKDLGKSEKGAIFHNLFGTTGQQAGTIMAENVKQLKSLDKQVQKSTNMDYVGKLSQKNMGSAQSQINIFKQSLNGLGISFATTVLPNVNKFLFAVDKLLFKINDMPKSQKKIVTWGIVAVGAIAPVSMAIGGLVKSFGALKAAVSFLGDTKLLSVLGKLEKATGVKNVPKHKGVRGSAILSGTSLPKLPKRYRGRHRTPTRLSKFNSGVKSLPMTLWSDAKTITKGGFSKGKSLLGKIPGATRVGKLTSGGFKLAGKVASKVPILDIAMAGTNLIGMNQHNAGKKVGATAGMLGGGALGSLLGPVGGIAGAVIGQMLGSKLGSTIQKTIPKKMQKTITGSLKGIGKTIDKLIKPIKRTFSSIGKTFLKSFSGVGKAWNKYVVKPLSGKNGSGAIKDSMKLIKSVVSVSMKAAGFAFKIFGTAVKTAIKVVGHVLSGLIKTVSGVVSLISDIFHGRWKNIWQDAKQIFTGIFGTIGDVFKDIISGIWDTLKTFGKSIGSFVSHPIKTIKGWFGGGDDKGKKHATGTTHLPNLGPGVRRDEHAIVNDGGGRELMVYPNGQAELPKGHNVHKFIPKGTNIFNAKDTKTLLGPVHHAAGTAKLKKVKNKGTVVDFDAYGKSSKKSLKSLKTLQKGSKKQWNSIAKDTDKHTGIIHKSTVKDFDTMQKNSLTQLVQMKQGSQAQMNQMHKGMNAVTQDMVTDFYKIFGKLDNYTHKAMAAAIKQLNIGISGINSTFSQFGGNTRILKPISYAKGSNGRIPTDQIAILNDAQTGPRQEAIVHNNGTVSLAHGQNAVHHLKKGEQVLNGRQTQEFIGRGGIVRYAKGSGVSNDTLEKLVENSQKNIPASWQKAYASHVQPSGSRLSQEVTTSGRGAASKIGIPWITAAWSVLSDIIGSGGGTRKAFLEYAEKHFAGKPYVMGGTGPSVYDCSGMVMTALKHFGIDAGRTTTAMQASSSLERLGRSYHLGKPGDLYLFGHGNGAAGHVGILKNPRTGAMFNETPPRARVTSINDVTSVSHDGVYRVKGLHDQEKHVTKANPKLKKLFKHQLGKKAISSLEDRFADNDLGSIGGQPIGDYESLIRKAAKAMHATIPGGKWMSYMLKMIQNESGGRAGVTGVNDGDGTGSAMGLLQYKRGTFNAYAVKGHKNILSAWDQLLAFFNNSHYKTDIGVGYNGKVGEWRGQASGPSGHRRFANGGWAQSGAVNVFGEAGQNEVAINTSRPSADPLLMEAISDRGKKSRSGVFAQFKDFLKMRKQAAEIKQSQIKFNEMRQSVTQPKTKTTIRPIIKFEPKIIVQNPANADEAKRGAQAGVKASYADFKAFMDSYVEASMA
ncbi:NlpC P60 family protein [Secundilactobacillus kimchicus JCM 15530]|uniref:NlpC P60 family protein n=2 Tax=Secundilactobacillus kimchicus TaxID=528209 RepID=A0A0R1HNG9_9LACO|nr:phage tail tape measure protein [Secundilactobacillus kimchicus]KRK48192.1 NlpC P60 family protein [Secundilactobacillus kimchicus JCM 15530]